MKYYFLFDEQYINEQDYVWEQLSENFKGSLAVSKEKFFKIVLSYLPAFPKEIKCMSTIVQKQIDARKRKKKILVNKATEILCKSGFNQKQLAMIFR